MMRGMRDEQATMVAGADALCCACTGYQYLVVVFFLVVFPLNVLIRSFASTITILYAWKNAGEPYTLLVILVHCCVYHLLDRTVSS